MNASMSFPGLSRLQHMGRRMADMRNQGVQSNNPVVGQTNLNPSVQGLPSNTTGASQAAPQAQQNQPAWQSAGQGNDIGTGSQPHPGMQTQPNMMPGNPSVMTPQQPSTPPPPAMSSLRDVQVPGNPGISSFNPSRVNRLSF
jgi:hypothetical protein